MVFVTADDPERAGGHVHLVIYGRNREFGSTTECGDSDSVGQGHLTEEARSQGKPVLAICRGLQILNVALGGTLIQEATTEGGVPLPGARGSR